MNKVMNQLMIKMDKKSTNILNCSIILVLSFLICLRFAVSSTWSGYDLPYHFEAIQTLNESWGTNIFFNKIYNNICSDFGYGTGLFYSTIPAGICVVFMNVFHINIQWAWCLEFSLLFAISGMIVYFFIKRIFDNKLTALICAICYIIFPYFLVNLFYRTAISELFLMLAIPCVAWGLYELQYKANYKGFMVLFTFGCVLSIFVHLVMTMYVAIFAFVFLAVDFKRFFKDYRYIPFIISCLLVLFITSCFYIPIVANYGGTQTSSMGHNGVSLYWGACMQHIPTDYNFSGAFLSLIVLLLFLITYFKKRKECNKQEKNIHLAFVVVAIMGYWLNSPLFPWFIMPKIFAMIQHLHRLLMINAILWTIEIAYILKYAQFKKWLKLSSYIIIPTWLVIHACLGIFGVLKFGTEINPQLMYNGISCYSANEGMGYDKNGDYYPTGASKEYIFTRANEDIIENTNCEIIELANFTNKNYIYFIVEPCDYAYVEFKIPFAEIEETDKVYLIKSDYINNEIKQVEITSNSGNLKLNLGNVNFKSAVVIKYTENGSFDRYLQNNPFEFKIKSGNANFSKFNKENASKYQVDISTTEETRVELPTLFYKGYKLTYTTASGSYNLDAQHGENGFIEIVVSESGTLHVEFEAKYVDIAIIISIVGLILFGLIVIVCLVVPRKFFTNSANWLTKFFKEHKTFAEICRFIIVGGIATLIDMFTMGVVMYLMQKSIYSSFINVFINAPTPSTLATIIGTTSGFCVGLLVNYVLSIAFVFNDKGNSKSAKGFLAFTVLSVIGLIINIIGTFIGFDLMHLNQWLVKIIMILIVLVYNYISKKLLLFKKNKQANE